MKFGILKSAVIFVSLLYDRKRQFTVPFNSAMCTRDVEYRNIMDKDPREHRLATPRLLLEIIKAQINSGRMGAEIKMPVLFQTAGKDVMVDPVLSRKIFARLTVKDKTIIDYPKMSHALPIDFGREVVFNDIITWMTDRI